ncbi:DUF5348 domain-containing protein [Sporosarcina sp. Marseille-Q4063]|uniref:DUF5348 domain-containing protein n=1 Tax=Sporosarcina sp. Marseille-Q4063 TaxID=2810514 RepID=UPI001BAE9E88|nr:DUF5348 domain-containing protein [Sporosarcina sp. Marseille-Q4063]QUW20891.1 DUF5348 domain-containing protein [Sporosarcina sp. Marseille-Q4063]
MKLVEDTVESYRKADSTIKRLLKEMDELMDNINIFNLNSEDVQKYFTLYKAKLRLEEAYSSIVDLNKEIQLEGYLRKNNRGRYELNGFELTSGGLIDIWRDDPEMKDGGYYVPSRIEHHATDYYCVDMPEAMLEGLKARNRVSPLSN